MTETPALDAKVRAYLPVDDAHEKRDELSESGFYISPVNECNGSENSDDY